LVGWETGPRRKSHWRAGSRVFRCTFENKRRRETAFHEKELSAVGVRTLAVWWVRKKIVQKDYGH